jgi:hypothetical protein
MLDLVTGSEYGILVVGFIGCAIFAVAATVISMFRKRK